jgi:hypothetical protein
METISNQEEEEKLNIPSYVRIINTSGFHIPASIINRAWAALSRQIATRSQEVVRTVDNNFVAYFVANAFGFRSVTPATTDTMTSYADAVYAANIGQNFTAGIIPEVLWKLNGYQELKLEIPIGEGETFFDLRIWVEVSLYLGNWINPVTDNGRDLTMEACLQISDSRLHTYLPPHISTLALHSAKLCGAQTFCTRE